MKQRTKIASNLLAALMLLLLHAGSLFAQKEPAQKIEQVQLPKNTGHITPKIESQINELVKPVREQLEKLYNADKTGTYKSYVEEMKAISKISDLNKRRTSLKEFEKKYYPFVKKIWNTAAIDEAFYQQKLRGLFEPQIRETIRFSEFLNFSISSGSQALPPPPPAPPAPAPNNVCVDANKMFRGSRGVEESVIGGAGVAVLPANPPIPAQILAEADAALLGIYKAAGWLRNTVSIPGTFPIDAKMVRVKKTFDWVGWGAAFTLFGCSWSTVAFSTDTEDHQFNIRGQMHTVVSPVTFLLTIDKRVNTTIEELLIPKTDLRLIKSGMVCFAMASASLFLSYGNANSGGTILKWEICEE